MLLSVNFPYTWIHWPITSMTLLIRDNWNENLSEKWQWFICISESLLCHKWFFYSNAKMLHAFSWSKNEYHFRPQSIFVWVSKVSRFAKHIGLGESKRKKGPENPFAKKRLKFNTPRNKARKKKFVAKDGSCLPNSTPRQQQFDLAIFVIFQQKLFWFLEGTS